MRPEDQNLDHDALDSHADDAPLHLPAEVAEEVILSAGGTDAILVGGQALGIWVDLLLEPNLVDTLGGPVTSKDVDFFGNVDLAQELADHLGGQVLMPDADHISTPEAAIVLYERGGKSYQIDILGRLAGLTETEVREGWIDLPYGDGDDKVVVRVMAPFEVLRSRIANIVVLRREDAGAVRQLRISPHVVEAYIRQLLDARVDPENEGDEDLLKSLQRNTQDLIRGFVTIGRSHEMDRIFIDHGVDLLEHTLRLSDHAGWHRIFAEKQIVKPATEGIEKRATRIAERERKKPGFSTPKLH